MTPAKDAATARLIRAAEEADWMQVVLNQGPPCFVLQDDGDFCLRAQRWLGHGNKPDDIHPFVSLADLLRPAVNSHDTALRLAEAVLTLPKIEYAWKNRLVELAEQFQKEAGVEP